MHNNNDVILACMIYAQTNKPAISFVPDCWIFLQWQFWAQLPNLIPANDIIISGYVESVADFGLVAVTTNYQIYFPTDF